MKVNASFKRFLCLLLVLLMFPLDALAVVVPGGGTNIGYAGGKTTKFRFREYVGIALGIQQMQGPDYTVTRPTEKEVAAKKKGTEGLANVTKHFLYSYPNPYSPSGGQGLFYIVPKAAGAPKYVAAVSSAGVGQAPSPTHDKINDIVVYNPVSNQNAIVVSLPKDRDQRIATHAATPVDKSTTCPGDASCPFLKNECSVTEHIHTESCYDKISYEVHGPNNAHTHTQDCKRHTIGTHGTWTSNSH